MSHHHGDGDGLSNIRLPRADESTKRTGHWSGSCSVAALMLLPRPAQSFTKTTSWKEQPMELPPHPDLPRVPGTEELSLLQTQTDRLQGGWQPGRW